MRSCKISLQKNSTVFIAKKDLRLQLNMKLIDNSTVRIRD